MKWAKDIEDVGQVTITLEQYEELLERDFLLGWLETTGVDNWMGWDNLSYMPEFSGFDGTIEEYATAWDKALGEIY